ncbi:MAG: 50S ribosomal protein L29 [Candidatus Omnitrophota bacterium]
MGIKPSDIRNMTEEEIGNKIISLREELFKLRFEQKTGRVEKPHRIEETRREVARCYTILAEKKNVEK